MPNATTTIKVPRALRDRIAALAQREHVRMAAAIERVLDEADDRAFWRSVNEEHAALTDEERAAYTSNATLGDDLASEMDDGLSAEDAW